MSFWEESADFTPMWQLVGLSLFLPGAGLLAFSGEFDDGSDESDQLSSSMATRGILWMFPSLLVGCGCGALNVLSAIDTFMTVTYTRQLDGRG